MSKISRVLTLFLLTISTNSWAKKESLPIELVALQADLIVVGKIVAVDEKTYSFKITEYIKGTSDTIINVEPFQEWICDKRYDTVEIGQNLILFLRKNNNTFALINASTGEIPILAEKITLKGEEYTYGDYRSFPYTLAASEFISGIKEFLNCYEMPVKCYDCYPDTLIQICTDEYLLEFINFLTFTTWIHKKVIDNYKVVKS